VYTPWSNLKKTGDMEVGQVGFHNTKLVKKEKVEKKKNDVVNRLDKTKREEFPDLAGLPIFHKADKIEQKAEREKQEREKKKVIIKNQVRGSPIKYNNCTSFKKKSKRLKKNKRNPS
jgi:hypothetical protein